MAQNSYLPEKPRHFSTQAQKDSGEIAPSNWRKKYDYIRAMAGFRVEENKPYHFPEEPEGGEKVEFDSIKAAGLDELKKVCDDPKDGMDK